MLLRAAMRPPKAINDKPAREIRRKCSQRIRKIKVMKQLRERQKKQMRSAAPILPQRYVETSVIDGSR